MEDEVNFALGQKTWIDLKILTETHERLEVHASFGIRIVQLPLVKNLLHFTKNGVHVHSLQISQVTPDASSRGLVIALVHLDLHKIVFNELRECFFTAL